MDDDKSGWFRILKRFARSTIGMSLHKLLTWVGRIRPRCTGLHPATTQLAQVTTRCRRRIPKASNLATLQQPRSALTAAKSRFDRMLAEGCQQSYRQPRTGLTRH